MKPTCIVCSSEFENTTRVSKEKYLQRQYCSRKCANKATAPLRHTPEARKKQSEKLRGVQKSLEHRQNLSKAMKESPKAQATQFKKGELNPAYGRNQTGPANCNWKGGITNTNQKLRNNPQMQGWRKAVYERDGYTCQDCGAKGYLQAHHIVPVSKDAFLMFHINNGKTVCVACHEKIHGRFIGKFKQK